MAVTAAMVPMAPAPLNRAGASSAGDGRPDWVSVLVVALLGLLFGTGSALSQALGGGNAGGSATGGITGTAVGGAGDQPQPAGVYLGPGAGGGFTPPGSIGTALGGMAPGATGLPQYQGVTDVFGTTYVGGGPGGVLPPGYTLAPSLTLGVMGNSNAYQSTTGKTRGDIWLMATPGVLATANTMRVVGSVNYSPSFRLSTFEAAKNSGVYQTFNVTGRISALPERLFINVLALGYTNNVAGGVNPSISNTLASATATQSIVQNVFLQISPTFVHHFGTTAIAQVGYTFSYTGQFGNNGYFSGSNNPYFTSTETTGNTGFGILRTGEDFGRLAMQAYAIGTEFGGNGALGGSQLYRAVGETRYSIYRDLAVYAEAGYDDQHYQGTTPFSVVAPIWGVGFRSQPDPENFILFRYGQRNGYRSPYLQATWRVGTRTQVNASYTDTFSSAPLAQTGLLSTIGVDANGNLFDTLASAPILPVPVLTSLYTTQSSLMRRKLGWLSANQTWDRDTFIASLNYFDMIPLTSAAGTSSYSQKGYSFSLGWNRAFTPTLNGNVFFSVGWSDYAQQNTGTPSTYAAPNTGMNYSARIGLYNYFSETLIGSMSYTYFYNPNTNYAAGMPGQSIFLATIRKNF